MQKISYPNPRFTPNGLYIFFLFSLITAIALLPTLLSPTPTYAQSGNPNPFACYGIGDEFLSTGGAQNGTLDPNGQENPFDYLAIIDRATGMSTPIGKTGTKGIEAMAFVPDADGPVFNVLYAVANSDTSQSPHADTLGIVDLATGVWSPVAGPIGAGSGPNGQQKTFTDVDGLAYDVQRDVLWATHRTTMDGFADMLFQIDRTTGKLVPDVFGADLDWVRIPVATDPAFRTPDGMVYDDIDDLVIDPTTGQMFAIMNKDGTGGGFVEVDPATGDVLRYIGLFTTSSSPDGIADDIEGLAFFNDGLLYGSAGNNGPQLEDNDKLYIIDSATGAATLVGAFPPGIQDIEALGCLTAPAAIVLEKATNGEDADTPTGPRISVGDPVTWTYVFTNTGAVGLTDITLEDDVIGVIGVAPNTCAEGPLPASLAPGASFTCSVTKIADVVGQYANTGKVDAIYLAPAAGGGTTEFAIGATDPSHYFGEIVQNPGIQIIKTAGDAADGAVYTINTPGLVTFHYEVTNTGNTHLSDITVTDDAGTPNDSSDDITLTSAACAGLAGPLAPGEKVTCTHDLQVNTDAVNIAVTKGNPTDEQGNDLALDDPADNDDAEVVIEAIEQPALATIGDYVWRDSNANGIQDEDEQGMADITVTLYDENDEVVATTLTDENGLYLFRDLTPGTYTVGFTLPSEEYSFSPPNETNALNDEGDSDVNPRTGRTVPTQLDANEDDRSWDAGIYGQANLTIEKTAHITQVVANSIISYTIVFSNTGTDAANKVFIRETVPDYTTFLPELSTPGWVCEGNNTIAGTVCTYDAGKLEMGEANSTSLTFVVIVNLLETEGVKIINNTVTVEDTEIPQGRTQTETNSQASVAVLGPTGLDPGAEPSTGNIYLPMLRK